MAPGPGVQAKALVNEQDMKALGWLFTTYMYLYEQQTCALYDGVSLDPVLCVEAAPERGVQVGALVVDGVVVRIQSLPLLYCHLTKHYYVEHNTTRTYILRCCN
jgi:hypothetical protein